MQPLMLGIILAAAVIIAWLLLQRRTGTPGAGRAPANEVTVISMGPQAGETDVTRVGSNHVERVVALPIQQDTIALNDRDLDPLQVHDKEVRP